MKERKMGTTRNDEYEEGNVVSWREFTRKEGRKCTEFCVSGKATVKTRRRKGKATVSVGKRKQQGSLRMQKGHRWTKMETLQTFAAHGRENSRWKERKTWMAIRSRKAILDTRKGSHKEVSSCKIHEELKYPLLRNHSSRYEKKKSCIFRHRFATPYII